MKRPDSIQRKVERKIFELQANLLSHEATEADLEKSKLWFQPRHFQEIIEERTVTNRCGWALCENQIKYVGDKTAYRINYAQKRIYEVKDSKNYCGLRCQEAAVGYMNCLDCSFPASRSVASSLSSIESEPNHASIDSVLEILSAVEEQEIHSAASGNSSISDAKPDKISLPVPLFTNAAISPGGRVTTVDDRGKPIKRVANEDSPGTANAPAKGYADKRGLQFVSPTSAIQNETKGLVPHRAEHVLPQQPSAAYPVPQVPMKSLQFQRPSSGATSVTVKESIAASLEEITAKYSTVTSSTDTTTHSKGVKNVHVTLQPVFHPPAKSTHARAVTAKPFVAEAPVGDISHIAADVARLDLKDMQSRVNGTTSATSYNKEDAADVERIIKEGATLMPVLEESGDDVSTVATAPVGERPIGFKTMSLSTMTPLLRKGSGMGMGSSQKLISPGGSLMSPMARASPSQGYGSTKSLRQGFSWREDDDDSTAVSVSIDGLAGLMGLPMVEVVDDGGITYDALTPRVDVVARRQASDNVGEKASDGADDSANERRGESATGQTPSDQLADSNNEGVSAPEGGRSSDVSIEKLTVVQRLDLYEREGRGNAEGERGYSQDDSTDDALEENEEERVGSAAPLPLSVEEQAWLSDTPSSVPTKRSRPKKSGQATNNQSKSDAESINPTVSKMTSGMAGSLVSARPGPATVEWGSVADAASAAVRARPAPSRPSSIAVPMTAKPGTASSSSSSSSSSSDSSSSSIRRLSADQLPPPSYRNGVLRLGGLGPTVNSSIASLVGSSATKEVIYTGVRPSTSGAPNGPTQLSVPSQSAGSHQQRSRLSPTERLAKIESPPKISATVTDNAKIEMKPVSSISDSSTPASSVALTGAVPVAVSVADTKHGLNSAGANSKMTGKATATGKGKPIPPSVAPLARMVVEKADAKPMPLGSLRTKLAPLGSSQSQPQFQSTVSLSEGSLNPPSQFSEASVSDGQSIEGYEPKIVRFESASTASSVMGSSSLGDAAMAGNLFNIPQVPMYNPWGMQAEELTQIERTAWLKAFSEDNDDESDMSAENDVDDDSDDSTVVGANGGNAGDMLKTIEVDKSQLFVDIWTTMDDVFGDSGDILKEKGSGTDPLNSPRFSLAPSRSESAGTGPGKVSGRIATGTSPVLQLIERGLASAESAVDIKRTLTTQEERTQYHIFKSRMMASAESRRCQSKLNSTGWAIVGLLIIDAIMRYRKLLIQPDKPEAVIGMEWSEKVKALTAGWLGGSRSARYFLSEEQLQQLRLFFE